MSEQYQADKRRRDVLRRMGIDIWVRRQPAEADAGDVPAVEVPASAASGVRPDVAPSRAAAPAAAAGATDADGHVAAMEWPELEASVAGCTSCGLCQGRTQTVFGVGRRDADIMVIGEAPGAEEDRQGEPFVGRAGQLLDNMLRALGYGREQVFIANILKCRPPRNRDPEPEEVAACRPYLARQIALVQPAVILAVGRIAAQNLLDSDRPLRMLRQKIHTLHQGDVPVVVSYHPAYLLRSPADKAKAWDDLKRLREYLPASEEVRA